MDLQELESEKFKEHSKSNISRDQKDSFVEELLDELQEENIDGTSGILQLLC